MNRIMVDTIASNIAAVRSQIVTVDMVAGYDTGTDSIRWTADDWALFPGIPHVHIDQGYGSTRSTEAHVLVFDIENNAFSPDQAESLINNNDTSRPTIYVNRSNLAATIESAKKSPNWKGDIWLAFPGWIPGFSLPVIPPDCRYVAIQNRYAGDYDMSIVLDNSWPELPVMLNWTEEMINQLPTLGIGAIGPDVRRIQALLVADGYDLAIDGDFGPITRGTVRQFQTKHNLVTDGVVGQHTWTKLLGL